MVSSVPTRVFGWYDNSIENHQRNTIVSGTDENATQVPKRETTIQGQT